MNLWTPKGGAKTEQLMDKTREVLAKGERVCILVPDEQAAKPWREEFGGKIQVIVGDKIQGEGEPNEVLPESGVKMAPGTLDKVNFLGQPSTNERRAAEMCPVCGQPPNTTDHSRCRPVDPVREDDGF